LSRIPHDNGEDLSSDDMWIDPNQEFKKGKKLEIMLWKRMKEQEKEDQKAFRKIDRNCSYNDSEHAAIN
jgi:hypothetical protein